MLWIAYLRIISVYIEYNDLLFVGREILSCKVQH